MERYSWVILTYGRPNVVFNSTTMNFIHSGDESAVPIGMNNTDATLIVKDSADPTKGVLFGTTAYIANDTLEKANSAPTPTPSGYASQVRASSTGYRDWETDRKSTRLNSSHSAKSRMPSSA